MKWLFNLVLSVLVLASASAGAWWLIQTRPSPPRVERPEIGAIVDVLAARPGTEGVQVSGMGSVIPARSLSLQSEVSGRVIEVNPDLVPGGLLAAEQIALRIDPRDFEYQVEQKKALLEKARLDLKLEESRQVVARREWTQLGPTLEVAEIDRELALRLPQLSSARAALAAAQASLDKALRDLERTALAPPFDALVLEESVEVGELVGPQTRLATLVAVDRFWVQVAIPRERLAWIELPGPGGKAGAPARVFAEGAEPRVGRVVRLLGDLDPVGRMARLLVEVERPLEGVDGDPRAVPLLLGTYTRVEIEGRRLDGVVRLPRQALREGSLVWLMDGRSRLEIRAVEVAWRDRESVLIQAGLGSGELVVTSPIAAPVRGMLLESPRAAKREPKS